MLCLISLPICAAEKLIFSLDLMRHGDRAPITALPSALYTGGTPLGHLTPEGIAQTHQLGIKFRQKYISQWHLLPETYDPKTIYVRSTDTDRTLMSAQTVLLGLYPMGTGPRLQTEKQFALPVGFQPIPIHTQPHDMDALLLCHGQPEKMHKLGHKYMSLHSEWQKKQASLAKDIIAWRAATGCKLEGLYSVGRLADTVMIYEKHGVPLPPSLTKAESKKIQALRDWIYLTVWQNYPIAASLGHPLTQTIEGYLQDAHTQKTPLKYVLFSAHDASIALTAGALKAQLPHYPGYSAVLNFSLMEDDEKQHKIHIFYNDKPLSVPGCSGNVCDLQQFEAIVKAAKENADPLAACPCIMPTMT